MSKTVKLEDNVYHDLDDLRLKNETFSQAVEKLLITSKYVLSAHRVLEQPAPSTPFSTKPI